MFERPYIQQLIKPGERAKILHSSAHGGLAGGQSTLIEQVLDKLDIRSVFASADAVANSGET